MTNPLRDLQDWYEAQCDGDWEHSNGIRVETLDNPGWLVEIDLADTLLENKPFDTVKVEEDETSWIRCQMEDGKFRGTGDPSRLQQIIEVFVAWAKSEESDWLAAPPAAVFEERADRFFWSAMGEEIGPALCQYDDGCGRKRIAHSVGCRAHHFEAVRGKPYPFARETCMG